MEIKDMTIRQLMEIYALSCMNYASFTDDKLEEETKINLILQKEIESRFFDLTQKVEELEKKNSMSEFQIKERAISERELRDTYCKLQIDNEEQIADLQKQIADMKSCWICKHDEAHENETKYCVSCGDNYPNWQLFDR
jgi:predicted transcriptional regulator